MCLCRRGGGYGNQKVHDHGHVLHVRRAAVGDQHRRYLGERRVNPRVENKAVGVSARTDAHGGAEGVKPRTQQNPVVRVVSICVCVAVSILIDGIGIGAGDARGEGCNARFRPRRGIEITPDHQVIGRGNVLIKIADQERGLIVALGGAGGEKMHRDDPEILVAGDVNARPGKVAVRDFAVVPFPGIQNRITADDAVGNARPALAIIGIGRVEGRRYHLAEIRSGVGFVFKLLNHDDIGLEALENPYAFAQIIGLIVAGGEIGGHEPDPLGGLSRDRRDGRAEEKHKDRGEKPSGRNPAGLIPIHHCKTTLPTT